MISGGSQSYRALGIGQRPFLDPTPFTSHLRELETLRRKAPPPTQGNDTSQSSFKPDPQGNFKLKKKEETKIDFYIFMI